MGKGLRSPLLGYNHNVMYRGRVYHVQTEDSGPESPHIYTHLFFEGTILGTKRLDYDGAAPDATVRALMQGQHKGILKELRQGQHDTKILAFFASRREPAFTSVDPGVDLPVPAPSDPLPGPGPGPLLPGPVTPPPHVVIQRPPAPSQVPGPGVYAFRGGGAERPFERPLSERPSGERPVVNTPRSETSRYPTPVAGSRPPVPSPYPPPHHPPPAVSTPVHGEDSGARPPVVVIRPPPQPGAADRRPRGPLPGQAPPGGVVVQRTVVVGGSGPGSQPQRPRRPHAAPYVVREGSHPIVQGTRGVSLAPPVPATPRPSAVPPVPQAHADSAPTQPTGSTPPPASPVSDKSLDEVILAYLSQDDEGRR